MHRCSLQLDTINLYLDLVKTIPSRAQDQKILGESMYLPSTWFPMYI